MSERFRGYSSTFNLKENPNLPFSYNRDILPANQKDVYISNGSQHTWHIHDKTVEETGCNALLDAPLVDINGTYYTRMSPGLDDWRQEKLKQSLGSSSDNSSRMSDSWKHLRRTQEKLSRQYQNLIAASKDAEEARQIALELEQIRLRDAEIGQLITELKTDNAKRKQKLENLEQQVDYFMKHNQPPPPPPSSTN